ncbi:hypothetical protein B9Z55_021469 [Caenorhabditis nigoni]|uniref:SCP domain-containing protein n=1 Tax=Caenorhabditis nigoni TaxID=1611254 RepID=A0A2G5TS42_9PELO|nr:hypothetical protein B9Z55_021469 [Caenorhabditis nigoni]
MKLLWILLLIAYSIVVDSSSDEQMKEKYLSYLNNERTKQVATFKHGNIWKLEWSTELAEKIKDLPKDCKTLNRTKDYRFFLMKNDLDDPSWLKWGKEEYDALQRNLLRARSSKTSEELFASLPTLHTAEMMIAGQKKVGCGAYSCSKYPSVDPLSNKTMDFEVICLFGPVVELESSWGIKSGRTGSKCEEEGGRNENGLCVSKDAPLSSNEVNTNSNRAHMIREFPTLALIVYWIFNSLKK